MSKTSGILALATVVLALLPGGSAAQTSDLLSVWFDPAGIIDRTTTATGPALVNAYLILQHASEPGGVAAWECRVDLAGSSSVPVAWQLAGIGPINASAPPSFQVGLGLPLPWAETLLLATAAIVVSSPAEEISISVHPFDTPSLRDAEGRGVPCYAAGGDPDRLIAATIPTGCDMTPVALINDDGQAAPGLHAEPENLAFFQSNVWLTWRLRNDSHGLWAGQIVFPDPLRVYRSGKKAVTADIRLEPGAEIAFQVQCGAGVVATGAIECRACGTTLEAFPVSMDTRPSFCAIEPPLLDFGVVAVGDTGTVAVTVSNTGGGIIEGELNVAPPFRATCGPLALAPGMSRNCEIQFVPTAEGGYLTGASGPGEGTLAICYGRTTADQACLAAPDTVDFGGVAVGTSASRSFAVQNQGQVAVVLTVPEECGPFQLSPAGPHLIAPGQGQAITSSFLPAAVGDYACSTALTECGGGLLRGSGVPPVVACEILPASLSWAPLVYPASSSKGFTVRNSGNVPVTPQFFGTPDFQPYYSGGAIAPGVVKSGSVTFRPTSPGPKTGVVTCSIAGAGSIVCAGESVLRPEDVDYLGMSWYSYVYPVGNPLRLCNREEIAIRAYLFLRMPSQLSGHSGWNCGIDVTGPAAVLDWSIYNGGVNALAAPDFAVALPVPRPWESVSVLGHCDIAISDPHQPTEVWLRPSSSPAIPGAPSYSAGADPALHTALRWGSGSPSLPLLQTGSMYCWVGVGWGPPAATAQSDGTVRLEWSYDEVSCDAFLLYRARQGTPDLLLSQEPLTGTGGRVTAFDRPEGIPAGETLAYYYEVLRGGAVIDRSERAEVRWQPTARVVTALGQNHPNPFNPATTIGFDLATPGRVRLAIYDVSGRQVCVLLDEPRATGHHEVRWDGRNGRGTPVPAGVYYCRLQSGSFAGMRKMLLLR